jgi:hypothetical protein
MLEQKTTQNSWLSEGFQANKYLSREDDSCPQWELSVSRLTSALVKEPSGWGIVESAPDVKKVGQANKPTQLKLNFSVDEREFRALAERWRRETRYISSVNKAAMHPAYQQIIGMGRDAVPLILRELERTRGHWLWALFAITKHDPAPEGATFDEAVDAWLNWGRQNRYLTYG